MSALGECLHPDWCGGTDLCRNCRHQGTQCDRGCHSDESWNERFAIVLECRYCACQFEHESPQPGDEFAPGGMHRLVLLGAPDRCPKCNNAGVRPRPKNVVDFKRRRPAW